MELIIVRHGQTEANRKGAFQGWIDLSLSEHGLKQIEWLRDELKGQEFDQIYVSPLKRTLQTAQIIREGLKNPPELVKIDALKEMNFGKWDGLCSDEIEKKYPADYKKWLNDWQTMVIPDGESAEKMFKRVVEWIDELLKKSDPNDKVMIVSHQGVILQIIAHLLGLDLSGCWHFKVEPGSMSVIEIKGDFPILSLLNHAKKEV